MVKKLVPLCSFGQTVLVGLHQDNPDNPQVEDALVVQVSLGSKGLDEPWSIQKKMKFNGFLEVIPIPDRDGWLGQIEQQLDRDQVSWIVDALIHPTKKSVESLIWVPDRLTNIEFRPSYIRPVFSLEEYNSLKKTHGNHGSWAIWNAENNKDTSVIEAHRDELHSRYVLVGLNISKLLPNDPWRNFHGGKHDRKLIRVCNDTVLRGAYMTDLFKDVDAPTTQKFQSKLRQGEVDIDKNVNSFILEMADIKVSPDTAFIVFGSLANQYYNQYFRNSFGTNRVVHCTHYSDVHRTDEAWAEGFRKELKVLPGRVE